MRHSGEIKFKELVRSVKELKKEKDHINSKLNRKILKLSSLSTRNVNKKIRRQTEKSLHLQKCLNDQSDKAVVLERDVQDLSKKLSKALKAGLKSRKKNYYLKNDSKTENVSKSSSFGQSYVSDLLAQISILQNEKLELEEKVENFVNKEVQVYSNGSYNNSVRMVYEDLLCMGMSTRNVEKVIRVVLDKLVGLSVGKLPKPTFAKYR